MFLLNAFRDSLGRYRIYNCIYNQCLSTLMLWVRTPLRRVVLDTTLCHKVCKWLAAGRWFYPGTPVSSTNNTARHDINEILWEVALNTITLHLLPQFVISHQCVTCIPGNKYSAVACIQLCPDNPDKYNSILSFIFI